MSKSVFSFRDFVIIGAGALAAILVWQLWKADAGQPPSTATLASLAKSGCRMRIEPLLTDPNSAEWQMGDWPARRVEDARVIVEPAFRARNGFGGMVSSRWVCEVEFEGTNWRVVRLEQI